MCEKKMEIEFTKMHGLGNDFVVIDATKQPFSLTSAQIQQMANRRYGIGFDQMLVIEESQNRQADFGFRIFNADGGEVEQCGNGARCVALYIKERKLSKKLDIRLSTLGGILETEHRPDQKIMVQMGVPRFEPQHIPFLTDKLANTYELPLNDQMVPISVVNVGNPHAVIMVDQLRSDEVQGLGEKISRHSSFPQGVNVGFVQVIDTQQIRLRVYERGSGETLACGSGACAAMVIGRRNGLLQERVTVTQPGGTLTIDWQGPQTMVKMTGPATMVYHGKWQG